MNKYPEKLKIAVVSLSAAFFGLTHLSPLPASYDYGGHLARIDIFLEQGFGWTQAWYNGFHLFRFYPPLYHVLASPLAALSFDLVRPVSFAAASGLAAYSMYSYSENHLSGWRSAASALLYLSGWFAYITHVSGSLPQAMAAAVVPLFFLKLEDALKGGSPIPGAFAAAAVVLFHHNIAFVAFLGAVLMLALRDGEKLRGLSVGVGAAFLTAFWALPALYFRPDASFGFVPRIGSTGLVSYVAPALFFAAPMAAKLIGSLAAIRKYRFHAAMILLGLLLSLEPVTRFLEGVPVLADTIAFRYFLLASFSASFLASTVDKRLLAAVLTVSLAATALPTLEPQDAGFRDGQRDAYEYLEDRNAPLVYDTANSDLRAYGRVIHGKNVADGWSIESNSIRPGITKLGAWEDRSDPRAVSFLRNWSVSHVVTYEIYSDSSKLRRMLEESSLYSLDRCFDTVCVFEADRDYSTVEKVGDDVYRLKEGGRQSLPHSSSFSGSIDRTPDGFLSVGPGRSHVSIERHPVQPFSRLISAATLVLLLGFRFKGLIRGLADPYL